jgi:hypothetical protein
VSLNATNRWRVVSLIATVTHLLCPAEKSHHQPPDRQGARVDHAVAADTHHLPEIDCTSINQMPLTPRRVVKA